MSILAWLKRVTRRKLDDEDFEDEIRAHLAIAAGRADRRRRRSARRAHYAALKDFGNVTLTTEAARQVWTPWWLESLHDQSSDVRYAIRALAKNPVFSLTVVGVLTLGIGLNAAVFTMLKSMALSPLAGVDGSARLGVIYGETGTGRDVPVSYPDYQYLRDHDRRVLGAPRPAGDLGQPRQGPKRAPDLRRGRHRQLLSGARRPRPARPHAPAVGRGRSGQSSGRRAQRCAVAARLRLPIPTSSARRVEINNSTADRGRRGRSDVPRHDRELRRRGVHSRDDGAAARHSPLGARRRRRPAILGNRLVGVFYPQGYLRPGTTLAQAAAADRRALERRCRATGR